MAGRITIQIAGDRADKDRPRLQSLIEQLEALKKTLLFAERSVAADQRGPIYYRVVALSQKSPATLAVEPVALDVDRDPTNIVMHRFRSRLTQIKTGKVPREVSVEELEAYQRLAPAPERHIREVKITVKAPAILKETASFTMGEDYGQRIADIIGPDEITWGTVTGRLEIVNLHQANRFFLYPEIGPERVTCEFEHAIREDVRRGLDKYVEVSGKLHYKRREQFAHRMTGVYNIEILDADDQSFPLSSLRGIAPDATGGMNTRDFVDSLDEEW